MPRRDAPLVCFDKRICKDCKLEKDLNVCNFELRSKKTGRMSLRCKVCERKRINAYHSTPKGKAVEKERRERYKEWTKAYHKTPKVREKARQLRQRPDHKALRSHLNNKRRAAKIQRTPSWADLEAIKQFYKNCPPGMTVDHIIPLQGEIVSGFHIVENLQYLTKSENSKKRNKF